MLFGTSSVRWVICEACGRTVVEGPPGTDKIALALCVRCGEAALAAR